jgi:hypothetical protein
MTRGGQIPAPAAWIKVSHERNAAVVTLHQWANRLEGKESTIKAIRYEVSRGGIKAKSVVRSVARMVEYQSAEWTRFLFT